MFCPRCGSQNPGSAVRCAACGTRMEAVPDVVEDPFFQKIAWFWGGISPAARALASVGVGLLGAWVVFSTRDITTSGAVIVSGLALAVVGAALGWASLEAMRARVGSLWCRAAACFGILLAVVVGLMPLVATVHAIAMLPKRMVTEPIGIANMRRMSVALQSYVEDHERLPGWVRAPDGRFYHNAWDQQLFPYVKYNATFHTGAPGRGIRSPFQPLPRNRVLTVALNGLLITRPKAVFDGNADWGSGPYSVDLFSLENPAATIVLAEVATAAPMGGMYAAPPRPAPPPKGVETADYRRALLQWIDMDPRAWVETDGPTRSYVRDQWDAHRGAGRQLHAGGASYAFADGHVQYRKLRETVTGGRAGMPPEQFWDPNNTGNMWNPRR